MIVDSGWISRRSLLAGGAVLGTWFARPFTSGAKRGTAHESASTRQANATNDAAQLDVVAADVTTDSWLASMLDEPLTSAKLGATYVARSEAVLNVKDYGAVGNGVTDDTAAIQSTLNALSSGQTAYFGHSRYVVSQLSLPNLDCTLLGDGAALIGTSTATSVIIYQAHRNLMRVIGLTFSGCKYAIQVDLPTATANSFDYEITGCRFLGIDGSGRYAIHLDGAREGRISGCLADGSSFLYMVRSVNCRVSDCLIENATYGINCDGDGSAFSCGPICVGLTMIGMRYGFVVAKSDHFALSNSMLDFCANPVVISTNDGGFITDNYISSNGDLAPIALRLAPVPPPDSNGNARIHIRGNDLVVYGTGQNTAIDIDSLVDGVIGENWIHWYKGYGISYSNMYQTLVHGNVFQGAGATYARYCVNCKDGTDQISNMFSHNTYYDAAYNRHQLLHSNANTHLLAGTPVYKLKGTFPLPQGNTYAAITFPMPFYDTPYYIKITMPGGTKVITVQDITTTGFVVTLPSGEASALTGYYTAEHAFEM